MRDGGKRRGAPEEMLPVSTYTPVSDGSEWSWQSLTALAYSGHPTPCHRRARMFIVPNMNVIIQSYPGWELQVD